MNWHRLLFWKKEECIYRVLVTKHTPPTSESVLWFSSQRALDEFLDHIFDDIDPMKVSITYRVEVKTENDMWRWISDGGTNAAVPLIEAGVRP